jgi:hypothetical protein
VDKVPLRQEFLHVSHFPCQYHSVSASYLVGYAVGQLVEALRYKPEGACFIGIFH